MTRLSPSPQEQLSKVFGSYRAEWLDERMFDLFTAPSYLPELTTNRPCVLLGGRGTGKTTVLRSLSYEGQFALNERKPSGISEWPFYGFYYRVNTNRVSAFNGPEITPERWLKVFGHYTNLLLCDLVVEFLLWHMGHCPNASVLGSDACGQVATSLHLPPSENTQRLKANISASLSLFESYINNIGDHQSVPLSLQGAPVDLILIEISKLAHFKDKLFFFLIDEYENYADYQQRSLNTLIKHSGGSKHPYTFKIGVRELGWRYRATLNENEKLLSPADYIRVNVSEKLRGESFYNFALSVCDERINRLDIVGAKKLSVTDLLPGLTDEEEADLLDSGGANGLATASRDLEEIVDPADRELLRSLSSLERYFIGYWARGHQLTLSDAWADFKTSRSAWSTRYENNKHAILFALRHGRRGIRKYYAGWNVFSQLAAVNIRFLLQLVDQSILLHLKNNRDSLGPISARDQTEAAQEVGQMNLAELEGMTVEGARLAKLLLGLGRVFGLLASNPEGHAPEITEFRLSDESSTQDSPSTEIEQLLRAAVMHLALLRFSGSKLSEGDTKDYDYMVHPIFSAFFVFSYRRKRRMLLSGEQLLLLLREPKRAIPEILASHNRMVDEPLPDQMLLFEGFYGSEQ